MHRMKWIISGLIAFVLLWVLGAKPAYQSSPAESHEAKQISIPFLIDGEPTFLYGLYHVSWAGSREDKLRALRNISKAGFNLMLPALDTHDKEFLDLAKKLGVYIIAEINDSNGTRAMVNTFKHDPAIVGWLIADDFNHDTPQSIRAAHRLVKSIAPDQLTYISGSTTELEKYLDVSDIIGIQTYSVPSDPLGTTNQILNLATELSSSHNIPIIANIQAWSAPKKRPPTAKEIRNMTYQALLHGVGGILYYTYMDSGWNIEEHPEIWQELSKLAKELKELTPVLVKGKLTRIASNVPELILGKWEYEEVTYLVMINTSVKALEDVKLSIDGDALQPLFEDQSIKFVLQNGELTIDIQPEEVYVFVLQ